MLFESIPRVWHLSIPKGKSSSEGVGVVDVPKHRLVELICPEPWQQSSSMPQDWTAMLGTFVDSEAFIERNDLFQSTRNLE